MSYLGIDVGTNSCKAVLLSRDGEIIFSGARHYEILMTGARRAELCPQVVWQSVLDLLQEAATKSRAVEKIQAVSFSILGEAITPVDGYGRPLANTLVSMDYRGIEECHKILEIVDRRTIYAQTGQPCNPMYPVSKILWWKRHEPDLYARVWKFLCWEDFLSLRLCGRACMGFSLASRTMLFNPFVRDWSDDMLSALHLEREMFAELLPSAKVVDEIRPALVAEIGLPAGTVFVTGGWDQACATLGAGVITNDILLENFGTTIFLGFLLQQEEATQTGGDFHEAGYQLNAFLFGDFFLVNGGTLSGGILLKWFLDKIKGELVERFSGRREGVLPYLMESLTEEPATSFFVPSFTGSGTPFSQSNLRGGVLNLDYQVDDRDILKALLESLCFEVKRNVDFLEQRLGRMIRQVRFTGGGSQSTFFSRLHASILERDITVSSFHDVSALGAALLAAAGVDGWDKALALMKRFCNLSFSSSLQKGSDVERTFRYRMKYRTYCQLLEKFSDMHFVLERSLDKPE